MNDEQKQPQDEKQWIDCEQCNKSVLLQESGEDEAGNIYHFYTCPFCGYSDADVAVA